MPSSNNNNGAKPASRTTQSQKNSSSTRCADPTPKTFASMSAGALRNVREHVKADVVFRQLEAQKEQKHK